MHEYTVIPKRVEPLIQDIGHTPKLIDVGSDHGYVSAYVLEHNIADFVIATDIHKAPAARTSTYLAERGLSDRSEVHCVDGLSDFLICAQDVVFIAGMGGMQILRIMDEALIEGRIEVGARFFIQPQRSFYELRQYMADKGFEIYTEKIALDSGRLYVGIVSIYTGKSYVLSLIETFIGPLLMASPPPLFEKYLFDMSKKLVKQVRSRPEFMPVLEYVDMYLEAKEYRSNEEVMNRGE